MPLRVWACTTDVAPAELARCAELVAPADLERAARLRSPAGRNEALVAAAFLRDVLGREVGAEPTKLELASTCRRCGHPTHGKPALVRPEPSAPLSFSLSHSAGLAVLAVADREVGVDVERVRDDDDVDGAAALVLTGLERAALAELAASDVPRAFLRLWTRKEAYLKGIGLGLVDDPARVTFDDPRREWAQVLDGGAETRWHVHALELGRSWVGALAVEGPPGRVQVRRWSPA